MCYQKICRDYHSFSPQIFSFLRDTDTHNSFVANKYTEKSNGFEWGWMMLYDIFFLKSMKNCWRQNKYHRKSRQTRNIWKQQHNSFPTMFFSPKSEKPFKKKSDSKVERQKSWRQQEVSVIPYRHPLAWKLCETSKKSVKLNFTKWKVSAGLRPGAILS